MKKLLILSLIASAFAVKAQDDHWNAAQRGFQAYDAGNYQGAKSTLQTATIYKNEFTAENRAKLYYYYGMAVQKTASDDLSGAVEAYHILMRCKKYDNGTYKADLTNAIIAAKGVIAQKYPEVQFDSKDLDQLKLYAKAALILQHSDDWKKFNDRINEVEDGTK